ncbi:MAG: flagellar biosynthetic protein FliO [Ferrovum sp.]|nr:flagellar biosynthetic protein FliO [Ferrovum sp.]NDU88082.1 flagellar biosynthetic protein FliO [Ferrovum sp.]
MLVPMLGGSLSSWSSESVKAPYAPPEVLTWSSGLQIVFSLVLVLALMAAVAWVLKKFQWGGARNSGRGTEPLRIVSSLAVGQRERVVLVEVQDTWVMVGVAPGHVQTLHVLPRPGGKGVSL